MQAMSRREVMEMGGRLFAGVAAGAWRQALLNGCSSEEARGRIITAADLNL